MKYIKVLLSSFFLINCQHNLIASSPSAASAPITAGAASKKPSLKKPRSSDQAEEKRKNVRFRLLAEDSSPKDQIDNIRSILANPIARQELSQDASRAIDAVSACKPELWAILDGLPLSVKTKVETLMGLTAIASVAVGRAASKHGNRATTNAATQTELIVVPGSSSSSDGLFSSAVSPQINVCNRWDSTIPRKKAFFGEEMRDEI